jgi:hypothetical protein
MLFQYFDNTNYEYHCLWYLPLTCKNEQKFNSFIYFVSSKSRITK